MNVNIIDKRGFTFFPSQEQLKFVHKELKFKPEVKIEYGMPKKSFIVYKSNPDGSVTVPRGCGIKNIGKGKSTFCEGTSIDDSVQLIEGFKLDVTRSQDVAIDCIKNVLNIPIENGGGMGLISLPCGGGKTVLFIYLLIKVVRKKAIIVVHTNQLADQWEERFNFFCPNIRIGRVQGSTIIVDNCDVVICMLQTLSMKEDLDPMLFDDFSVLGIDECHLVCTETFCKLLTRWGTKYIFGLSATPTRKDKLENVLFSHLSGLVYSGTREKVPLRVVFEYPDVSQCTELMNPKTKKPDHVGMITSLVEDEKRTRLVATKAVENMMSKVLVLSERRNHLERIMHHIIEINGDYESEIGLYRGKMKPEELKDSETKSIILGTYSIASVGLDIKGLNTLILATPRSDVVQASGRIQRDISPLFEKKIVDIYDKFSVFTGQYAKRLQFYRASHFEISGIKRRNDPESDSSQQPKRPFQIDTTLI